MITLSINSCGLGSSLKKKSINNLCTKFNVSFLGIQETHLTSMDFFSVKALWGNYNFDFAYSSSRGKSGGILSVWSFNIYKVFYSLLRQYSHCGRSLVELKYRMLHD
jgi:hypothetical protein